MEDVCGFLKEMLLTLPTQITSNPDFRLVCVVMGHDRGIGNKKLRVRHFTLSSDEAYTPREGEGVLTVGANIPEKELDAIQEASEKNVKSSNKANKKLIGLIAETNNRVGGKVVSETIRNDR